MKKTNILLPISIVLTVCIIIIANLYTFTKSDKFVIKSNAFKNNQRIPKRHVMIWPGRDGLSTIGGEGLSPMLIWENASEKTKSFALICNVPNKPWACWVIYNIPAYITCLNEGITKDEQFKNGITQGCNLPKIKTKVAITGYIGTFPGEGKTKYYFRLYALKRNLKLKKGLSQSELMKKIRKYIIGKAVIIARS